MMQPGTCLICGRTTETNYEPCSECAKHYEGDIFFLETRRVPSYPNQPVATIGYFANTQASANRYPTGNWRVVEEEKVRKLYSVESMEQIAKDRIVLTEPKTYRILFQPECRRAI